MTIPDIAVVVVEPEPDRVNVTAPLLHFLNSHDIPYIIFINKMVSASARVRDILNALQGVSSRLLVLLNVPVRSGEKATGYVDLVSERAYACKLGESSALIEIPNEMQGRDSWDVLEAYMPQLEVHGLIIDLRSLTQGLTPLIELSGCEADQVVQQRKEASA